MKFFVHSAFLVLLIGGIWFLNHQFRRETAFMKKVARVHLDYEKRKILRMFGTARPVSRKYDSIKQNNILKDLDYLRKIDSNITSDQFCHILGSMTKTYALEELDKMWSLPPDIKALYLNDMVLTSLDSINQNMGIFDPYRPFMDSFLFFIHDIELGDESLRFKSEYFEILDLDSPYIHPITQEIIDEDRYEIYEPTIQEY